MSFLTTIRRLKIIYPKQYVAETKQLIVYNSSHKKLIFFAYIMLSQIVLVSVFQLNGRNNA